MGDFNVNLINCNKNRGTYEFLEQLFNHNFTPKISFLLELLKNRNTNRQHLCKWPSTKLYIWKYHNIHI